MDPPLDTNLLIRYLTADHTDHSPRAYRLFVELAAGRRQARLTEAVLVETVQVLSSRALYNLPRAEILRHLRTIISFRGVRMPPKRRYLRALELYAGLPALSFVDALLAIYATEAAPAVVISFDGGFDRVVGLTREEPG